jgi:hypothetical protein
MDPRLRALQTLAATDRASRALAAAASATVASLQPTAAALGDALRLTSDASAAAILGILSEEEARAGPAAALSSLIAALQPRLLELAGAAGWQVVARGRGGGGGGGAVEAAGPLLAAASLADAGPAVAAAAAAGRGAPIVVVERLRGEEDVPPGCGGVVVVGSCPDGEPTGMAASRWAGFCGVSSGQSQLGPGPLRLRDCRCLALPASMIPSPPTPHPTLPPAVLCHAAVRARALGVPLVACLDPRQRPAVRALAASGARAALRIRGDAVELSEAGDGGSEAGGGAAGAEAAATGTPRRRPTAAAPGSGEAGAAGLAAAGAAVAAAATPAPPARWLVTGDGMAPGAVGAKSANTWRLDALLPPWLLRPTSAALPLGALPAVLADPSNAGVTAELRALEGEMGGGGPREAQLLADIRWVLGRWGGCGVWGQGVRLGTRGRAQPPAGAARLAAQLGGGLYQASRPAQLRPLAAAAAAAAAAHALLPLQRQLRRARRAACPPARAAHLAQPAPTCSPFAFPFPQIAAHPCPPLPTLSPARRLLVLRVKPPEGLRAELADTLCGRLLPGGAAGAEAAPAAANAGWAGGSSDWEGAEEKEAPAAAESGGVDAVWAAVLAVWASAWGPGAAAALAAAGLPRSALRMGVLLQPVAPLRYSFVAHTLR